MLETFNVLRIDEPDFGCEGRPDGMEVKDNVLLKSNYNSQEDRPFWKRKIAGLD